MGESIMSFMSRFTRHDIYFPAAIALVVVVLGSLPYVYGYASTPPDYEFMGFIGRDTPGANSYLAFAQQAANGQMGLTNLYTPDSPSQGYYNLEWGIMGWTARWTGCSLITLFHVGRVVSAVAFVFAAWYLCLVCLAGRGQRRGALLLISFGAGLGWIPYGSNALFGTHLALPLDAQGVSIFAYLVNKPHFIRAGVFAALQYAWFIRGTQRDDLRYFALAGLAAAAHSIIRPYQIPESCLFLLLYGALTVWQEPARGRRVLLQLGVCAGAHLPAILWHGIIYIQNPLGLGAFVAWQPVLLLSQLLWLGIPFCAVLAAGAWGLTKRSLNLGAIPVLAIWLVVAQVLLQCYPYFPWGVESYFPWVLAPPLLFVRYVWPARAPRVLLVAMIVLVIPCNVLHYGKFFNDLRHPDAPWVYYLHNHVGDAMTQLSRFGDEGDVVLASHDTSQFVPRLAGLRVVAGQDALSVDYEENNALVLRFFQSPGDVGFKEWFVRTRNIDFVFVGPFEQAVAPQELGEIPWLAPVYSNDLVTIYRTELPE